MKDLAQWTQSPQPIKWLFYGDSITHGALHTFGYRDYTELFAERVRFELGRTMDVVINTAISGHTTRTLLESFEWRVAQFAPHVVLVMIGMNDCSRNNDITVEEFAGNLRALDQRIAALGGQTILQTTCPILPGAAPDREPDFPRFMQTIRDVAGQLDLPLVDHAQFWAENSAKHFYWMSDAFHPNAHGHLAFAHLLYKALNIHDPQSHSCRLYFP